MGTSGYRVLARDACLYQTANVALMVITRAGRAQGPRPRPKPSAVRMVPHSTKAQTAT